MSYNPRPNPSGDDLVSSRDQIRTNFEVLQDRFDENHEELDGGSGGGKHKFLQMPEQASAPTTAADEGAVYTKESGGQTELFFRRESDGDEVQISGPQPTAGSDGFSYLPGNILIQWLNESVGSGATKTVNWPTSFSSAPYVVTASDNIFSTSTNNVRAYNASSTQVTLINNLSVTVSSLSVIAIGPA